MSAVKRLNKVLRASAGSLWLVCGRCGCPAPVVTLATWQRAISRRDWPELRQLVDVSVIDHGRDALGVVCPTCQVCAVVPIERTENRDG